MADASTPRLRWFQYRLRTLLMLMLLASIGMSWLAVRMKRARMEHEAAKAILKAGGQVAYVYELDAAGKKIPGATPPAPTWLRNLLGNDLFDGVAEVRVGGDAELEYVKHLPNLQSLSFWCGPKLTDAGLAHLQEVPRLRRLHFGAHQNVTDAGLVNLTALTQLQRLEMRYLQISDAGLEHLAGLNQLQELYLGSTAKVTDEGVKKLQQALPNCRIIRR